MGMEERELPPHTRQIVIKRCIYSARTFILEEELTILSFQRNKHEKAEAL